MSPTLRIAREEWRYLLRHRIVWLGLGLLTLLTLVATLTAWEHQRHTQAERARYQAQADAAFHAQPDRHPHRVAHYGHFLFRPLNPLAAFDPGVDAYTGNTLFLEAHRQNSANFGDVRQSSLLLRFGQLTPAFVLQVLAPLLLIFAGHAGLTRERESGTWRVLLAQGVRARALVGGKLLALGGLAALSLLPATLGLLALFATDIAAWPQLLGLWLAYALWLALWTLGTTLASVLCTRSRDALLVLIALWCLLVILLPRGLPPLAEQLAPLPTRFEHDIQIQRDYLALGDSHNPNDPKFAAFKAEVLAQYGVSRIEDLPVNFKGLVAQEGERRSSELFRRYAAQAFAQQERQSALLDAAGWVSPLLALRRVSLTLAGTDLPRFRQFTEQGETYRYLLVQRLNRLQADTLTYAHDTDPTRSNRIAHTHWQQMPPYLHQDEPVGETLARALPATLPLLAWLALLAGLLLRQSRRLERSPA